MAVNQVPAGFTTPPLTPNSPPASVSNGIDAPAGDSFVMDQAKFDMVHDQMSVVRVVRDLSGRTSCGEAVALTEKACPPGEGYGTRSAPSSRGAEN